MKNVPEFSPRLKFVLALIGVVALMRLLPHEYNFTPVGAIALFAGTYITNKRLALLLPMAIMLFSDLMLELFYGTGFYRDMLFVYGSFALIATLGFALRNRVQAPTIAGASLLSSLIFFLITNFGTWLMYDIYSHTPAGLYSAYLAGLPFLKGTLTGDFIYNALLFGIFALAMRRYPALAAVK